MLYPDKIQSLNYFLIKKVVTLSWLFSFLIPVYGIANNTDSQQLLDSANSFYTKGMYDKAIQTYEAILAKGYSSTNVYFNMGNTYYKLGNIGKAILNYERAKKISPNDPDIDFNLKLAYQQTVDKVEPIPKLFLEGWWDHLKSMHSEKAWAVRSITYFIFFFAFLGLFIVSKRLLIKQAGFGVAMICLLLTLTTFAISRIRYHDSVNKTTAIVLSSSSEAKNAPADTGMKLFILHEGTNVSVVEISGEWAKVELTPEKVGWVKRSAIEYI